MGSVLRTVMKDLRAATSALSAADIRAAAATPPRIGIAAVTEEGSRAIQRFLVGAIADEHALSRASLAIRFASLDEAGDFDLLICEANRTLAPLPVNAWRFDGHNPDQTVENILSALPECELALACVFPVFRNAASQNVIRRVSSENALFAAASALPNVLPGLLQLPWAIGEFASDTAFITMNQVRMALQLAALHGNPVGYAEQRLQLAAIAGGALGWRALARELVGKIPLGGGVIPKAAIAYAGTWVVGESLKRINRGEPRMSFRERREAYAAALEKGKAAARDLIPSLRRRAASSASSLVSSDAATGPAPASSERSRIGVTDLL